MTTMIDVAALAGVSPSTVSYVMTGKRPISEETRHKVLAAASELGWEPNSLAKALRSSRSGSIAVIGPRETRTYAEVQGNLLYSLSRAAQRAGFDLLLKAGSDDPASMTKLARSAGVDAIILTDVLLDDPRVRELEILGFPTVSLGRTRTPDEVSWVDMDFEAAGRLALEHLASLGHTSIALLGPPPSAYLQQAGYAMRTLHGVREAASNLRVALINPATTETLEGFAAEVVAAFDAQPAISGLILQYEPATPFIARILENLGRAVPRDVSVIAIAPRSLALHSQPPIDYIELELQEMGHRAIELAVELIDGKARRSVLLPASIVALGSSGAFLNR